MPSHRCSSQPGHERSIRRDVATSLRRYTMLTTRFTELVGCTIPIQQAGMGAVAPPELAAAVSEAGGLGMLGTAHPGLTAASLAQQLKRLRALTARPFGVNFIVAPQVRKHLDL